MRVKILTCFLFILTLFLGLSFYQYWWFTNSHRSVRQLSSIFLPLSRVLVQLQGTAFRWADDVKRSPSYIKSKQDGGLYSPLIREMYPYVITKRFALAEDLTLKLRGLDATGFPEEVSGRLNEAKTTFDRVLKSQTRDEFESSYKEFRVQLQTLISRVDREVELVAGSARERGRNALIFSLVAIGALMLLGSLGSILAYRLLRQLPLFIDSVRKIADGDFSQSLKVKASARDELATLAREYNRMIRALLERDKQIQAQQKTLLQAERLAAVGQLSAEVVHEIRNPLNALSLNIDWLTGEVKSDDPRIDRALQSLSREILRLNQIAEGYLIRSRTQFSDIETTEVHELIEEILEFLKEEHRDRKISIQTDFMGQSIYLKTDRSKLKQAFLNVLKNAKEAMPMGGQMEIRTYLKNNVYRIEFSDTGHGMTEATRRKTFSPFFTTKPNGTGLGLTLTKTIIEEAQGTLHFESELGRGTTCIVQFPA